MKNLSLRFRIVESNKSEFIAKTFIAHVKCYSKYKRLSNVRVRCREVVRSIIQIFKVNACSAVI